MIVEVALSCRTSKAPLIAPLIIAWYCKFADFISGGIYTYFSKGLSTILILNSHPVSLYLNY